MCTDINEYNKQFLARNRTHICIRAHTHKVTYNIVALYTLPTIWSEYWIAGIMRYTYTHKCTVLQIHRLMHSCTRTHAYMHILAHTPKAHTNILAHTDAHTHNVCLSIYLSPSLAHTVSLYLMHTVSHTHIRTTVIHHTCTYCLG